jgi:anti-sigma B factor antagonist
MADPPLRIDERTVTPGRDGDQASSVVLALIGDLDPHTAPMLAEAINSQVDRGASRITVDLAELEFIDSSGLRVLIAAHRDLAQSSGQLTLSNPSESTLRLFEVTGLLDQLDIRRP